MSEENISQIKKTKYKYNDLFSHKLNLTWEIENWQKICTTLEIPSDENILQTLDTEFNYLCQLMNETLNINQENRNKNFEIIGETSDAYQKVISIINSFIQQVTENELGEQQVTENENYQKLIDQINQETNELGEQIDAKIKEVIELDNQCKDKSKKVNELDNYAKELQKKRDRLQNSRFIFFRKYRSRKVSEELIQTNEQLQQISDELTEARNQLNQAKEDLIQTNERFVNHTKTLKLITNLSQKLIQLYENKVFLDQIPHYMLNVYDKKTSIYDKKTSIQEILSSQENAIPYVEQNSNSKTYSGQVSTVFSTEDENGDKKFVKPGRIFYTVPKKDETEKDGTEKDETEKMKQKKMEQTTFAQTKAMRYLPENEEDIKPGEMYYVDSASRQSVENFVADMLGHGEYFVRTKTGISKTGKVSVMDEAKGIPGSQVLLYKQSDKEKLETFLDTDMSQNIVIALETNEKDENGNSKLVIKKANKYRDLIGNLTCICATEETQLSALVTGLVDFICAQIDRHSGNFFIDKNGKITNIDNDAICIQNSYEKDTGIRNNYLSTMVKAKIPFLTPELKEKFMYLYNNKDIFFNFLKGKMNIGQQENIPISVIEERLEVLYNYINDECPIVTELNENSLDLFLQAHENFKEDYGEDESLILTQSNPIAIVSCPCSEEYIDNSIDQHFCGIKSLLNDKLSESKMEIEDNKWTQAIVSSVAKKRIDNLMLKYQISCADAIQLVIEPMVKCIQNDKHNQKTIKNLFTKIDDLAKNKFQPLAVPPLDNSLKEKDTDL